MKNRGEGKGSILNMQVYVYQLQENFIHVLTTLITKSFWRILAQQFESTPTFAKEIS
jgi:hypothetical protein